VPDILYLAATAAFFGLMVAYVHGCERLGRTPEQEEDRS
jgi:hypothetical protein